MSVAAPERVASSDLPADAVHGGYRVVERLHAGGAGYIYRVEPPPGADPGFPLVMKVPAVGPGESVMGLVGFEMELMIQPALAGAHVPRFVAAGDLHTTPFLVMEHVAGTPLATLFRSAPLPEQDVARVGQALADALASLHAQGAVHHDLKPENVILREDGSAVLLDFGYSHHARYPDLISEESQFEAGSAAYVSPEQLRRRRGDPRSDLFALGALLYELATGEPPFGTPQTLGGLRDRLWKLPVPPRALQPTMSAAMQEVILRCLEIDPARRYPSATLVAFDLRNLAQVAVTARGDAIQAPGFWAQLRAWWAARHMQLAEESPPPAPPARVVLVAVDTTHLDDARHPVIQWTAKQVLAVAAEHRMMCVSVIRSSPSNDGNAVAQTESGRHLEHLAHLRRWVEPLGLPVNRLSLHVLQALDPAAAIVRLARDNHADLIVLGAPAPDEKPLGWWRSVASGVTANAHCSVHVVRIPAN